MYIFNQPHKKLKSRNPVWKSLDIELNVENKLLEQWMEAKVNNSVFVKDLTKKLLGFELPRTIWTAINRIRTEQDKLGQMQLPAS